MNGVEVGIAVDFPLATAAKMGLRFNSGKQFSLNVAVNGGETDRAVRMSKRPASRNFLRRPKMVETINDIRSQLKVSLERRVAEMSAPCLRLFVGRELRFRRNSRETEEGALPSASAIFRMLRFFL